MSTYLDKIIYKAAYCFFLQRFIVNIQNLDFSCVISLYLGVTENARDDPFLFPSKSSIVPTFGNYNKTNIVETCE